MEKGSIAYSSPGSKEEDASRRDESFKDFFNALEAKRKAAAPSATPPARVGGRLGKTNDVE